VTERDVVVERLAEARYPTEPPFDPPNPVHDAVRAALGRAGVDTLGRWIRPGMTVLLKPNWVAEGHPRFADGWRQTLTHGSVIRAVADLVFEALDGRGQVVVADGPQTDSSFDKIVELLGMRAVEAHYRTRGLDFAIVDLRREQWENREGVIVARRPLPGDPRGYVAFDLAGRSELVGHRGAGRYYGADYDAGQVNHHHTGGRHEYLIAGTAIHADVIVSLPKLKTHKKAGITVTLKNLVGINGDKNWLPHHTEGDPETGGDEHPRPDARHRFERRIVPYFRKLSLAVPGVGPWIHRLARRQGKKVFGDSEDVVRSGNWWGNDTVWRMCLDLNKIALYGEPDGTLRAGSPKPHLSFVDGVVAGEGRGPGNADPVDAACAILMGFDPERIPIVRQAFRCAYHPLASWGWRDVVLHAADPAWRGRLDAISDAATFHFAPHFAWKGHIERTAAVRSAS
jgi:uncharacterized protein (DUF362 family)